MLSARQQPQVVDQKLAKELEAHRLAGPFNTPPEDPCLFANYRLISLLPNFSKFFEKVMYNRLTEFAETDEI